MESERRNLLLEIEELRKMADSKAKALENEVSMLREEVKSLRVLLGGGEPELDPEPKRVSSKGNPRPFWKPFNNVCVQLIL